MQYYTPIGTFNNAIYNLSTFAQRYSNYSTVNATTQDISFYSGVQIGEYGGYYLYRRRYQYNNVQVATNTELVLTNYLYEQGTVVDHISISDKSYIQSGSLRLPANCMYSAVYVDGTQLKWRQGFSSSLTWKIVVYVEGA